MRSYYEHLATTTTLASNQAIPPKPIFRSSAIFPIIQQANISSRILFLGYWILKRNIREIASVITLRNLNGSIATRTNWLIQEAKTYRIELAQELEKAGLDPKSEFIGSLEIEFFSTQNLVFPYPAVVINYYGPSFSSVVHTAQRVYNDFDDMQKNSQTSVPESGFNIYADENCEPFIGLINGSISQISSTLRAQITNEDQDILNFDIKLHDLAPYETIMVYPARYADLKTFLKGKLGVGKIYFDVKWIFPRLVVGNFHHKIEALTITHTYYDCSQSCKDSDYWPTAEPGWHPASLMLPASVTNQHFTKIYFYPIYSPSKFAIDVEIYSADGTLVGLQPKATFVQSPTSEFHRICVKALCENVGIPLNKNYAVRLIAYPLEKERLPARIKIGLDIGVENFQTPCNICTNLQPFNRHLENKPSSFKWNPILADQPKAVIWIMNSSPAIAYQRDAEISLTFFRENDMETLKRNITIPPHGFLHLELDDDTELTTFFNKKVGWMTATTSNPYTTIYYFAESSSGVIGGDHGF